MGVNQSTADSIVVPTGGQVDQGRYRVFCGRGQGSFAVQSLSGFNALLSGKRPVGGKGRCALESKSDFCILSPRCAFGIIVRA